MMFKVKADTIIEAYSFDDALYQLQVVLQNVKRCDNPEEVLIQELNMSITKVEE